MWWKPLYIPRRLSKWKYFLPGYTHWRKWPIISQKLTLPFHWDLSKITHHSNLAFQILIFPNPPPSFNFQVPPRLVPPPLRLTAGHPARLPFLFPHGQLQDPQRVPFQTASPPPEISFNEHNAHRPILANINYRCKELPFEYPVSENKTTPSKQRVLVLGETLSIFLRAYLSNYDIEWHIVPILRLDQIVSKASSP